MTFYFLETYTKLIMLNIYLKTERNLLVVRVGHRAAAHDDKCEDHDPHDKNDSPGRHGSTSTTSTAIVVISAITTSAIATAAATVAT